MDWARMLAYVTGTVDQELLARNEYLAAENRILKVQLNGRLKLSDATRGDPAKASSPKPARVMSTWMRWAPGSKRGWSGPAFFGLKRGGIKT
jgi:hypothetical protein